MDGISFVIITNGKKFDTTTRAINSIIDTINNKLAYEIILVGDTEKYKSLSKAILLDYKNLANTGNLSAMRNRGAEIAKYDTIVITDDDILFDKYWYSNLAKFSLNNDWDVYSCKLLSPDGSRCWDRAVVFGEYQSLVEYSHNKYDKNLYQTGGYLVIKKNIFLKLKFDESITYYSNGLINEDVDFSKRLYQNNYHIEFDEFNSVYHEDDSLIQVQHNIIRKENLDQVSELPTCLSRYEQVYNAYINILHRLPDESGFREYLINTQYPIDTIVKILTDSDEHKLLDKEKLNDSKDHTPHLDW